MRSITGGRPNADEYASFFAGYIGRVPDGDILTILQTQLDTTHTLLAPVSHAQALARPTPADWNILEVLGHITDGEQVFAYRALRIARGDTTPLAARAVRRRCARGAVPYAPRPAFWYSAVP